MLNFFLWKPDTTHTLVFNVCNSPIAFQVPVTPPRPRPGEDSSERSLLFTGALLLHKGSRLPYGIRPPEGFEGRLRADNPRDFGMDDEEYKSTHLYKRHTYYNVSVINSSQKLDSESQQCRAF